MTTLLPDDHPRCARRRDESVFIEALDPFRFGSAVEQGGSTHVAAVVKRGKLLSVGTNRAGTRSRGSGFSAFSLHAERAAVKALGDLSLLRGAELYVVRLPHAGHVREGLTNDLLYSRPCHECTVFLEKCMRVWGLRRVLYTTDMTVALAPLPPYLAGLTHAARPPAEGGAARSKWERQTRSRRRRDAISGHEAAARAAAAKEEARKRLSSAA
jgi:hypothetical protein